jgi:hypothetical protein
MFVSVVTYMTNHIKPSYNSSSCVRVIGYRTLQDVILIICPIQVLHHHENSLRKRLACWLRPLPRIIPENRKIVPEINLQKGQRWPNAYCCRRRDQKWGPVGKKTSDARWTPTFRSRWASTVSDITQEWILIHTHFPKPFFAIFIHRWCFLMYYGYSSVVTESASNTLHRVRDYILLFLLLTIFRMFFSKCRSYWASWFVLFIVCFCCYC